jgi:hypothetical protein
VRILDESLSPGGWYAGCSCTGGGVKELFSKSGSGAFSVVGESTTLSTERLRILVAAMTCSCS